MNIETVFSLNDAVIVPDGRKAYIDGIHINVDEFGKRVVYLVRYDSTQFPLKDGYTDTQLRRFGLRAKVKMSANTWGEGTVLKQAPGKLLVQADGAKGALWYPANECEVIG